MSTTKNNPEHGASLGSEATLEAIDQAQGFLREADAHIRLRDYRDPDTLDYDHLTHEGVKCLVLARVCIADALSLAEDRDDA